MADMVCRWHCYSVAMTRLWYDNSDVIVQNGRIARMSLLPDCIPLGEEASFPNFEGKGLYLGDPIAFLLLQNLPIFAPTAKGHSNACWLCKFIITFASKLQQLFSIVPRCIKLCDSVIEL